MKKLWTLCCALFVCSMLWTAEPSSATGTTTASATFDAVTDTPKPVNDTTPRGSVVFSQAGPTGAITGVVHVTGLAPSKAYLVVPYTDGVCTPDPGGTAFPSSRFATNAQGAADAKVTVNPQAVNPLASLDLNNVRSISIREVLVPAPTGPGVPPLPNAPWPITEACDMHPVIR